MDSNQSQGDGKPSKEEVETNLKQQEQTLGERAKTAGDRLDKFFEKQGEPPKAEEAKQPEPPPSSDQKEAKQVESKVEETKEVSKAKEEDLGLPEEAKERTKKRVKEVLDENKALKEKLGLKSGDNVFDSLREELPKGAEVPQASWIPQVTEPKILPDGTVDTEGLNRALTQAELRAYLSQQEAIKAREEAQKAQDQVARFEETQQVREAHAKFSELDPDNEDFDPKFFDLVRNQMLANKAMKVKQSLVDVAESIKSVYAPATNLREIEKAKEEGASQAKEALEARQQGPLESSKGEPRAESTFQELRTKTRRGDPFALDERMRTLGIIGEKPSA